MSTHDTLSYRLSHRQSTKAISALGLLMVSFATIAQPSPRLELYVDTQTKQVFTEPGPQRVRLGTFEAVSSEEQSPVPSEDIPQLEVGRNGLEVSSGDEAFTMRLGGRIQADATAHSNDQLQQLSNGAPVEAVSGTEIRRARLALAGTFNSDFGYLIESDWAGDKVSMKDVFISYRGHPGLELTVGNQKHAVSMEVQESSNDIMFNERSLLSALTLPYFDRAVGFNAKTMGRDWSLQGGLYGDAMSSSGDGADEGSGWGLRATVAPINMPGRLLHLGASMAQRQSNDNNTLVNSRTPRFSYETTNMSDFYLVDTGALSGFEDVRFAAVEVAAMHGPLSFQAEVGQTDVKRDGGADLSFDAYYVQVGWTLTGEARDYRGSDGEFKRLQPSRSFNAAQGEWGAWELGLRLDEVDLNDADILGGSQQRLSLNLNWYLNQNLRVLFGFSRAFDIENSPLVHSDGSEPDDINVFSLRTQLAL